MRSIAKHTPRGAYLYNQKPETRNQKPETRNQKPETSMRLIDKGQHLSGENERVP